MPRGDGETLLWPSGNAVDRVVPGFCGPPVDLVRVAHDALGHQRRMEPAEHLVIQINRLDALGRGIMEEPGQLAAQGSFGREPGPEFLPYRGERRLVMPRQRGKARPLQHLPHQGSGVVPGGAAHAQRGRRRVVEQLAQEFRVGGNRHGILSDRTGDGAQCPAPVLPGSQRQRLLRLDAGDQVGEGRQDWIGESIS